MTSNSHIFALFFEHVASFAHTEQYLLADDKLFHRMVRVLRLQESDRLILFNQHYHATVSLQKILPPNGVLLIIEGGIQANTLYQPAISLYLPLLKKEALEEALYNAIEVGIQHIQFYHAHKAQLKNIDDGLERRLQLQTIAAAEQSKNYVSARMEKPISFDAVVQQIHQFDQFFVCDPGGVHAADAWASLQSGKRYALLIGPEGGLTKEELAALAAHAAYTVALTPTILRAPQAVAVAGGMLRSL